ncbi:hypothetical protein GCM10023324_69620 [Streptomyces youssoufiensis]
MSTGNPLRAAREDFPEPDGPASKITRGYEGGAVTGHQCAAWGRTRDPLGRRVVARRPLRPRYVSDR